MTLPNEAYVSNSVPYGGFSVNMYRDQTNPTLVGEYIMESGNPTDNVVEGDRPDVDGGDNGWWIVNGKSEGPATFQLATDATPTLQNGFFFLTTKFKRNTSGTPVAQIFIVKGIGYNAATTDYRKQSVTIREDKAPTAGQLAITEASD